MTSPGWIHQRPGKTIYCQGHNDFTTEGGWVYYATPVASTVAYCDECADRILDIDLVDNTDTDKGGTA